jgi:hypothetical protein
MPSGVYIRIKPSGKIGQHCSDETKLKISLANKGRISPTTGMKWKLSDKSRKNISIGHIGVNNWAKGKPWSEARRKAQELRNGTPYIRINGILVKEKTKPIMKKCGQYDPNWHEIRKAIYIRDNWTCQECSCKCHNTTKNKIQCHHIDYDKMNNEPDNLITLCASCHMKTNYKKDDWTKYFKERK